MPARSYGFPCNALRFVSTVIYSNADCCPSDDDPTYSIKQKASLLLTPPMVKVRPVISHFLHRADSKVVHTLSILVVLATRVEREKIGCHVPIWRTHQGTHLWLQIVAKNADLQSWLRTVSSPCDLVIPALCFWMVYPFARRRSAQFFTLGSRVHLTSGNCPPSLSSRP